MRVFDLYRKLADQGVALYTWDLGEEKAVTMEMGGQYALFMDFDNIGSAAEETVVAYHEGGHICTGATHKVASPYDLVERHEYRAWKWAIQNCISKTELEQAVADGCTELWQMADRFEVTEDFMQRAICWYRCGNASGEICN